MKNSNLLLGSVVFGANGTGCKVLKIEGDSLTIDTPKGIRTISTAKVVKVIPPAQPFDIGDRVTLIDKYMVRAADIGTVEAITDKGTQILWDNKSPYEPNLKQPPVLWRTFQVNELELIDRTNQIMEPPNE